SQNTRILLTFYVFIFAAAFAYGAKETVQRISWEGVEGVFLYEVRIEQRGEDGNWQEMLVQMVENAVFLDCEISPGYYRFSVRSFDILKRPGSVSEWAEFTVENGKAGQHRQRTAAAAAAEPAASGAAAASGAGSGDEQKVIYAADTFNNDTIRAKPLRLELLWVPLIPLPTGVYNAVFENTIFQGAGFAARLTVLPLRFSKLQAGVEARSAWNFLHGEDKNISEASHIFGITGALVLQALILHNTAISARAGGGVSLYYSNFIFNLNTSAEEKVELFRWNPAVYTGIELNCFLGPSFVLSLGVEYAHVLATDNTILGYVRPVFGMGVWF
ncbi:MAG: hypothetical protein LBC72_05430, partial [Spirochaetaceae bacterium]|nr:hypothetical protein [Spirochaetaceae bacterium]